MGKRDFTEFVNERVQDSARHRRDGKKRWEIWNKSLEDLYQSVQKYLSEYIENGSIRIERKPVSMSESLYGRYEVDRMVIHIGDSNAELLPIGAEIIGAYGRVDLRGWRDIRKLVLVPADAKGPLIGITAMEKKQNNGKKMGFCWKFSNGPDQNYIELSEDNFRDALISVTE